MAKAYRRKIAIFLYWCFVSGGALAILGGVAYAIWLYRTDPSWDVAKVLAVVIVGRGVLVSITDWLFDYAQEAHRDTFTP